MRLALALTLLAGVASAQGRIYDRACDVASRRSDRGGVYCVSGAVDPTHFRVFQDQAQALYLGDDRLPSCTTDPDCALSAGLGVWDGGTAWQWISSDGGLAAGTWTAPTSGVVIESFIWGQRALDIRAAADAPSIINQTTLEALLGNDGGTLPSTVWGGGYSRATGTLNFNNPWLWSYYGGSTAVNQCYLDSSGGTGGPSGTSSGFWMMAYPAALPIATAGLQDGWGNWSQRYDGVNAAANHVKLDVNFSTIPGFPTGRYAMQPGVRWGFGVTTVANPGQAVGTDFLNGPYLGARFFWAAKSDPWRAMVNEKFLGFWNPTLRLFPEASATATGESVDNVAITGNIDILWSRDPNETVVVEPTGLRGIKRRKSRWAATSTLNAGIDVGTPTIATAVAAGPMSTMRGGALTAERMTDNDGAAWEGKRSLELINAADRESLYETTSIYAMVDATADFTIRYNCSDCAGGAAVPASCPFTATATWARYGCPSYARASDGGFPSGLTADILIGHAPEDTGAVLFEVPNATEGPFATLPWTDNSDRPSITFAFDPATLIDGGTGPAAQQLDGGAIEVVFVAKYDPDAPSVQPTFGDPLYLLDLYVDSTSDHTYVLVGGYTGRCRFLTGFRTGDGTDTDILATGACLTAGHAYAHRGEWLTTTPGGENCNLYVYLTDCGVPPALPAHPSKADSDAWRAAMSAFIGSCKAINKIAELTDGTGTCPGVPDRGKAFNRLTNNVPSDGNLLDLRFALSL